MIASFCRFCGAPLNDGAAFCRKCGKPVDTPPAPDPAPAKTPPKDEGPRVYIHMGTTPAQSKPELKPEPAAEKPAAEKLAAGKPAPVRAKPKPAPTAEKSTPAAEKPASAPAPTKPAPAKPKAQPPKAQAPAQPRQKAKRSRLPLLLAAIDIGLLIWIVLSYLNA